MHDDKRQYRQQDNHDREHADERERSDTATDFFLHHLPERLPTPPDRGEEHDHVMHAAAQRRANQDPKRPRQVTKLRREHRTDQRTWTGDRRKVMAKRHPAIRRHEIFPVFLHDGWRRPLVVQTE